MEYDLDYTTSKKSKWTNQCKYIMLHHTGWGTFESSMNYLAYNSAEVSVHYVIWAEWEIWRIWLDNYIMWHAGTWNRSYWTYINDKAIWIEIVSDWHNFTEKQLHSLRKIVIELQNKYDIWINNIIRHKDYTTRKWDIWDAFYKWYSSFKEWKESLNEDIELNNLKIRNSFLEMQNTILKERLLDIDKIVHWKD